jgi:hypothetical protein
MTRMIVVLLVGALAWMVWWAVGKGAYEQGLAGWIDERRTDGWVADVGSLDTRGFPNRFDTTVADLNLADPETGVAWSVPVLQILSLAYKPHQVIAVVSDTHRFSTPLASYQIRHDDARASLFLKPEPALGLDSARLVLDGLDISSSLGWQAGVVSGRFAVESVDVAEDTYRLGADIEELALAAPTKQLLDPAGVLPDVVEAMRLDATLAFNGPWDRFAIEDRRPQPTRLVLDDVSAVWGSVTFRAAGALEISPDGYPDGEITVRAVQWRQLLEMAVSSGVLPKEAAGPLERALALMSGQTDTLDAKFGFRGGMVRLGIIPIAPAPRLAIR